MRVESKMIQMENHINHWRCSHQNSILLITHFVSEQTQSHRQKESRKTLSEKTYERYTFAHDLSRIFSKSREEMCRVRKFL